MFFKKTRDSKGKFHAKMRTIKVRNCMDLKKERILRRGGKNTCKNYKKDLHDPDNQRWCDHSRRARYPGM